MMVRHQRTIAGVIGGLCAGLSIWGITEGWWLGSLMFIIFSCLFIYYSWRI